MEDPSTDWEELYTEYYRGLDEAFEALYEPTHPILPARLQPLIPERWSSMAERFGDVVLAQARVRCGVRDCPGDFGRVTLSRSSQPVHGRTEHLLFEAAPGFIELTKRIPSPEHGSRLPARPVRTTKDPERGVPLRLPEAHPSASAFWKMSQRAQGSGRAGRRPRARRSSQTPDWDRGRQVGRLDFIGESRIFPADGDVEIECPFCHRRIQIERHEALGRLPNRI